jgi:predicted Zn-dependent protease
MKRSFLLTASLIVGAALSAVAAPNVSTMKSPAFPGTLANARFVYVASYDGDQFDGNVLPEDRAAINAVQNAIQNWGKLTLVYQPSQADIIILVTSRPSEDLMAVYDARMMSTFLWRVMGRDGLQSSETPLVTQFEKGFESVALHNAR